MHHTIALQTETPQTEAPKRFQCRHIFTDGHRCGSPCLRGEDLCYYHHTTRKPALHPRTRRCRRAAFELPLPEDRSAIQHSIGQVLQRIAANDIDPRRAGLLLYGLQIASLNLPKPQATTPELVEETTTHPELGTLAPPAEVGKSTQRKSAVTLLIEKLIEDDKQKQQDQPQPATLPTLQAAYDPLVAVLRPCSHPDPELVEGEGSRRDRSRLRRLSISAKDANGPMLNPLPHPFDRTLSLAERGAREILHAAYDPLVAVLRPCGHPERSEGSRRGRSRLRRLSISAKDADGPMLNPLPLHFDRTLSVAERGAGETLHAVHDPFVAVLRPCSHPERSEGSRRDRSRLKLFPIQPKMPTARCSTPSHILSTEP
jgi:hypothetical protein